MHASFLIEEIMNKSKGGLRQASLFVSLSPKHYYDNIEYLEMSLNKTLNAFIITSDVFLAHDYNTSFSYFLYINSKLS